MIEAVENHMPEVIIVDEIGTEMEALACRTIAERGVQLVGTAHGQLLENLIKNPTLSDLVGRAERHPGRRRGARARMPKVHHGTTGAPDLPHPRRDARAIPLGRA